MQGDSEILFWRRTDVVGLERLRLHVSADAVLAESTVICVEDGGFRLDHRWRLTSDWRAQSLDVDRWGPAGHTHLTLERTDGGWCVNGQQRPDLDGAEEPDLSVTPFCNTFPIRRTPAGAGQSRTLDTCFVDGAAMTVQRSRQRYDRLGPDRVRYVDLGVSAGFEADLEVDNRGLVLRYQHLFERVTPV
ncbi:putative glycolipid-binding domain-containing protein [Bradyrhizobium sp. LMTR 3]|uniref:putative glycolipid-binding domain-containing protein n=1 Tax=Bradyrhizobium sp. LMTR 3 TaxID=189873 RepID=UPI000A02DB75|nr:putative glycolipid-binding domain-containing protein [Bradyrhizobium sp. LMTR 3]